MKYSVTVVFPLLHEKKNIVRDFLIRASAPNMDTTPKLETKVRTRGQNVFSSFLSTTNSVCTCYPLNIWSFSRNIGANKMIAIFVNPIFSIVDLDTG